MLLVEPAFCFRLRFLCDALIEDLAGLDNLSPEDDSVGGYGRVVAVIWEYDGLACWWERGMV